MIEEDSDELLRTLREAQRPEEFAQVEARMRSSLEGFHRDLKDHPYAQELARRGNRRRWLWLPAWAGKPTSTGARIAWAAGSAAAALVVLALLFLGGGNSAPTWAEVSDQFQAAKFVHATVYSKSSDLAQPEETEIWLEHGGRVRMRTGATVAFLQGDKVRAFDIGTRRETTPSAGVTEWLKRLGAKKEFSLDATLSAITGGRVMEAPRLVEPAEATSRDEAVFDIRPGDNSPETIRVWTLAKSRLPTRMQLTDPRSGASITAIFSYIKELSADPFDPDAFEARMRAGGVS